MASTRQVGSADSPVKEHIPIKEHALIRFIEADMAWCMPWCVKHEEAQQAYGQLVAVMEVQIRWRAGIRTQPEKRCSTGCLQQPSVLRMKC